MKNLKKFIALFVSGILIMTSICSSTVNAEEPEPAKELEELSWTYEYTGTEQAFTAPYSGVYQFEIYGAQGGGDKGGKGGSVTVTINIAKGTTVTLNIGGKEGYNGGGMGSASNGGGATDIRIDEKRIAIAGGGGGGTGILQGGAGGSSSSGDNGLDYIGTSDLERNSGYKGGTYGYYYTNLITPHQHSSGCYSTCNGTIYFDNANNDGLSIGSCNTCGRTEEDRASQPGMHPAPRTCERKTLTCTKSTTPEEQVISKASSGGSNWYDSTVCSEGTDSAGVREGNGECRISVKEIHNLFYLNIPCKNVYYKGTKVKKVYYNGILVYKE